MEAPNKTCGTHFEKIVLTTRKVHVEDRKERRKERVEIIRWWRVH